MTRVTWKTAFAVLPDYKDAKWMISNQAKQQSSSTKPRGQVEAESCKELASVKHSLV